MIFIRKLQIINIFEIDLNYLKLLNLSLFSIVEFTLTSNTIAVVTPTIYVTVVTPTIYVTGFDFSFIIVVSVLE